MKKLTFSILAAGLAALTLASCGGDAVETTGGKTTSGATPTGSASTTATTSPATSTTPDVSTPAKSEEATEPTVTPSTPATEETETTEATEPTTEATEPTTSTDDPATPGIPENLYYAIDVDITIIDGNAGIVFSGADTNNFVMWQLAIGEYGDGMLYLRPHVWQNGGGRCIEDIYLNLDVPGLENVSAEYDVQHHMTIRVFNDGIVETLIDGVSCGTTDSVASMILTDQLGLIGFRCDAYSNGTIPEKGAFDNLKITDGTGAVLYEDDFSDENSALCSGLIDGTNIVLEDGVLMVSGKILKMTYVD